MLNQVREEGGISDQAVAAIVKELASEQSFKGKHYVLERSLAQNVGLEDPSSRFARIDLKIKNNEKTNRDYRDHYTLFVCIDKPVVIVFKNNPPAISLGAIVTDRPTAVFKLNDFRAVAIWQCVNEKYQRDRTRDDLEKLTLPKLDNINIGKLVANFVDTLETSRSKVCVIRKMVMGVIELSIYGSDSFPSIIKTTFISRRDGRIGYQIIGKDNTITFHMYDYGQDPLMIKRVFDVAQRVGVLSRR